MHLRHWLVLGILPAALAAAGIANATSVGAPASKTGAPAVGGIAAEPSCQQCHNTNPVNTGATLEFINAPSSYSAGLAYNFSVQISSTQTSGSSGRKWSFELVAINMTTGASAGTFTPVTGMGTEVVNGSSSYSVRQYLRETGNRTGNSTPETWNVQWTAPDPGVGTVGFFAAGVAANGSNGNKNDWVATTSQIMADVTAVEPATWGSVKSLYR